MVKLDILFDKLRFEEKALYNTAIKKGIDARLVDLVKWLEILWLQRSLLILLD
jgi:hypothetical protein